MPTTHERAPRQGPQASSSREMHAIHERAVAAAGARRQFVTLRSGQRLHLVEAGKGAPVLHLHGTGTSSLSHLPLLQRMPDVWSVAVDRPGAGLSDPVALPRRRYREAVVEVLDEVMDALGLESAVLAGASGGGAWAIWYALARPRRVRRLALLGATPLLPGTTTPPPMRVMATPVVGDLVPRFVRPSRATVVRLMRALGESDTIVRYPDLLDSLVAAQVDPVTAAATAAEFHAFLSPFTGGGMRRSLRLRAADLHHLRMPTLLVWGTHDPLGGVEVARSVASMVPDARLEVLACRPRPLARSSRARVAAAVGLRPRGRGPSPLRRPPSQPGRAGSAARHPAAPTRHTVAT